MQIAKLNFVLSKRVSCDKIMINTKSYPTERRNKMIICYDKLWNILNNRGMMKTDLIKEAKISTNAMAKLGKNENVRVEVLAKICVALDCEMNDILEIIRK